MGACSSTKKQLNTENEVHSAGNMAEAPNTEAPKAAEAPAAPNAEANLAGNPLASPVIGGMNPPQNPAAHPQAMAAAGFAAGAAAQGLPQMWIDPRTNKPLVNGANDQIPLNNLAANQMAFDQAAAGHLNPEGAAPQPAQEIPLADQGYVGGQNNIIFGAVTANLQNHKVVEDGHWQEFESVNNVITMEEYAKSLKQKAII